MKEKVINILKEKYEALSIEDICSSINNVSVSDIEEIQKILNNMVKDFEVYYTNKGRYILFENCKDIEIGEIDVNPKGFGFLLLPGDDVHIEKNKLNGAIDGDKVIVEILTRKPKLEGRVIKIVQRNLNNLVGEVKYIHGKPFVSLEDKRNLVIELDKKTAYNCVDGTIVVVDIISEKKKNYYIGKVNQVVGHKDDAGVDILTIAYKHEIYPDFSDETIDEVNKIENEVSKEELIGRKDLTDKIIFTIDGDDTKDIDDAISLEYKNGNYLLGVHIADVSYYVKEGSPLNEDAYKRGTSAYLADTVIPMLPHKLSNGICSLNENVIRLTQSCMMEIDKKGNIVDYDIFESYIKSSKRMTYKNVNMILKENIVPKGYEKFADTLKDMNNLAHILRNKLERRGYINFDASEAKIICDDNGRAIDIQKRIQDEGEKLIEEFMIAANETVATAIYNMDLPFIYRVHDIPDEKKINDFIRLVSILGYKINGNIKDITPIKMQKILNELKEKPEFEMLSTNLLRCMKKAKYQVENIGHFGLGSKCYTHFTSPIRRYPDLIVHRLLREYLYKHNIDIDTIKKEETKLTSIAMQSSDRELKAVEAEREVDDMKMAEYMETHIGEVYEGKISGLTNFGMFVELDNLVEGLVHLSTIKEDYYTYNSDIMALIGQSTKKMYRLADKVTIKVVASNKTNKTIDFELIERTKDGDTKQKSKI